MKRDAELAKEREEQESGLVGKHANKDKDKNNPKPSRRASRNTGGGAGSNRPQRSTIVAEKKYSGEGITKVEGVEQAKFDGKDVRISDFRLRCRYAPPDKLDLTDMKLPIIVDGRVLKDAKDWTVVGGGRDGDESAQPLVVMHIASTERVVNLHKDDSVRLYGWLADEAQTTAAEEALKDDDESDSASTEDEEEEEKSRRRDDEENARPPGLVFFAMDLDRSTRVIPGLNVQCTLANRTVEETDEMFWDVTVQAANDGPVPISNVEVEVNVYVDRDKKKKIVDNTFVYVERIESGKSASVACSIPNWTLKEREEASAHARLLGGKAVK
jgi:hypothetical protein